MATWRLTVHGDTTGDQAGKDAEAQIPAALEAFTASLEAIAGTGVYLVQFEGSAEFQRLRGEDLTMVGDAPAVTEPVVATEGV
jgi:hypothetical protein